MLATPNLFSIISHCICKKSLNTNNNTCVCARTRDRKAKSLAVYRLRKGVFRTILRGIVPVLHADGDVIPPFAQIK